MVEFFIIEFGTGAIVGSVSGKRVIYRGRGRSIESPDLAVGEDKANIWLGG